jgi:hypothetical protein
MTKINSLNRSVTRLGWLLTLLLVMTGRAGWAQSVGNYVPTRATSITYTPLSSPTNFSGWRNGTNFDDNLSVATDIGFPFVYDGAVYTQFSASTNGFLTFNTATTATGGGSGAYGFQNTQFSAAGGTVATLAPLYDDLSAIALTNVRYQLSGSAPNRTLTVEWIANTATRNFQVTLYEVDGKIEYSYGSVNTLSSYSLGINAPVISGTPTAAQLLTLQTANTTTFSATPQNSLTAIASNSRYTFTPPATVPAAPTTLTFSAVSYATMTVGWTDNSTTETGFGVLTSTDNVTFTAAGNVTSTTTAGTGTTYSLPLTGLTAATTYYVRVVAVTEGRSSTALTGSQATLTPITFSGTPYTINNASPTAGTNFNNFTDAFLALNAGTVTGNTTISVVKNGGGLATYDEAPLRLTQTGTSSATLSFVSAGGNPSNPIVRGTGGTLNSTGTGGDAIIRLVGSDYVTFDGIDLTDNPSNVTATTRMESGLLLDGITGASGCQNNTFRNATITLNKLNSNTPTGIQVTANAASAAGANSNNSFRNLTITNAARGYSLNNGSATFPDLNNSIDVTGGGTSLVYDLGGASLGPIQGVELANQSGVEIKNTTFRDFAAAATIYGIGSTTGTATSLTVQNCRFSNLVNSSALVCAGVYITSHSSATPAEISNCQIEPISPATLSIGSSVSGAALYGVFSTSGSANVFGNRINNITQTSTLSGGAGVMALSLTGSGVTYNVSRNAIHTIVQSASAGSFVSGITIGGATANVSNNMISNIRYDRASGSPGVRAIVVNGGSTINLYYNTVYLTGTAAVTNHNSAALYLPSNSGTTVDYRNNLFFNNYTGAGGTLKIMAVWKTSGTVNNPIIATTTNNNLVYGVSGLLENSGSLVTTLAAYRATLTGTRESLAVTESTTPFAGTTDPHLTTAANTQAEAGAASIGGFEDDFDALNTRLAASYPKAGQVNGGGQAPDIGADEGDYKPLDLTPPMIVVNTPLATTTSTAAPTLTNVSITDASGVNVTAGTKPRVYYKLSTDPNVFNTNTSATAGWKFVEATGTTSPFSFTFDFSLLPSAPVGGTTIQYFVTAQDLATVPNVGIDPASTFAATPTSVSLTSAAFPIGGTPLQYTILESFSGTISVGPGQTYNGQPLVSLTAAGGLFARLNGGALTGNLTVLITGDITIEDGTNVLRPLTEVPAASNFTISVQPSAATVRLITGASNSMGTNGITLNGADRVTFDGRFNQTGTTKYLRFRSTSASTGVFTLVQDATNNVIRDCFIESNNNSASTGGITLSGSSSTALNGVTAGVTGNDFNTILNDDISSFSGGLLAQGIYSSIPNPTSISNSDNTIQGCNIFDFNFQGIGLASPTGGNWTISGNSFYNTGTFSSINTATSLNAISMRFASTATGNVVSGNYIGGSAPQCGGTAWVNSSTSTTVTIKGIQLVTGATTNAPGISIDGNFVQKFSITGSGTSNSFIGIDAAQSTLDNTSYSITNNTVSDVSSNSNQNNGLGTTGLVGIAATTNATASTAQLISGNTIFNLNLAPATLSTTNIYVTGIQTRASSTNTGTISRNRIYNLTNTGTAATAGILGISLNGGTWTVANNQVTLTNTSATVTSPTNAPVIVGISDNVSLISTELHYFNSVWIGGTGSGTTKSYAFRRSGSATSRLRNNVFVNERTGGAGNFAVGVPSGTTFTGGSPSFNADYNDLYSATAAQTAENNTTARDFGQWQALGPEANGKNVRPKFTNLAVGNLNLDASTNCQLDGVGLVVTGINGEYDNAATSRATTPDLGSDEFTYAPLTASIDPPAFTCTATTGSVTINGSNGPWTVVYTDGVTPVSTPGVSTSPFTFPAALGFTYTLVSVTDAYGCALNVSGSLTTTTTTTWTGAAGTDWYNPGNWTACVPTATIDAVIPTGFSVVISNGTAAARNLDIQGSSTLAVNTTGNLDVYGTFTVANGTSYQPTVGVTTFKGTGAQPIPGAAYAGLAVSGATPKVLAGNVSVATTLDLSAGMIELGNFDLLMANASATVVGADPTHFAVVSGTGRFGFAQVGSGGVSTVTFPIGTTTAATDYNPATLANTGTQDTFWARVTDVVPVNPTNPVPAGPNVVKKTWDVSEVTAGGSVATLTLAWDASDEGIAFDRANCGISHFTGSVWDFPATFGNATSLGGTRYAVSRAGLTSFSPFAVEDDSKPLPVELSRFEAIRKGQDAELTWATASEKNNQGFEVQVSTNGTEFRRLAFVASQSPTSQQLQTYSYLDSEVGKSGVRYYRLKQIDQDGATVISPVRTLTFEAATTDVVALPNPFGPRLTVRLTAAAAGSALLTLTDALGREVFGQRLAVTAGSNDLTPTLPASLAAGTYTLGVTVDGQRFRTRVVRE